MSDVVRDAGPPRHDIPDPLAYDAQLRERVAGHLRGHARRAVAVGEHRHAAVALVLVDSTPGESRVTPVHGRDEDRLTGTGQAPARAEDLSQGRARAADQVSMPWPDDGLVAAAGGASFLLCRRPLHLKRHAGQYALPGGRLEPGEGVVEAALRETHEEVGVDLPGTAVLGLLDDYVTRSGFVMTPVVLWGGTVELRPDPNEVMAVYRVGLHHLLRADSPRFEQIPESPRPVVSVPLGTELVHAPTAAVLIQLGWLGLQGRSDPVHDFDQPVFAWR